MPNLFIDKGNLADSPQLKTVPGRNGDFTVATMRVRFSRYRQDDNGDIQEVGGFWREVEAYNDKAEICAKLLRKGYRVQVIGEEREYTGHDDDGKEVQVFKIVAEDVSLCLTPRILSIDYAKPEQRERTAA